MSTPKSSESIRLATAAVQISERKVDPLRSRNPTAVMRIPAAISEATRRTWRDHEGNTRVQHFPNGLIVVGHPDSLRSYIPGAQAIQDYVLRTSMHDTLSLPSTVGLDAYYDKPLNPVSILHGFDRRALVVPSPLMEEFIQQQTQGLEWALGRLAHSAIAEEGRNKIDTTEAVAAIAGAVLTRQAIYANFPEAYQP